jgi:nucleoside transporter
MIADRYFAAERVLASLHLIGAALLYLVTRFSSFGAVYAVMLAYCLCFSPTIALTNSLTLRQVKDASREFPFIRVFASIGWIAIGQTIGRMGAETSATPFLLASGASLAMSLYCLTLPHTPPDSRGQAASARTLLGLDALVMLKQPSFRVFVVASIMACIPLTFYFSFTNAYLNDLGVENAAGKMTLGQVSEVGVMLLMPFVFRRLRLKTILLLGLLAWSVRYGLLAAGNASSRMWMFYLAILLHGVCFAFFFVTGQLYTDQEAPPNLRGTAQGLLTFLTYGVGMFVGSILSGGAVDLFTTRVGSVMTRNWSGFWLSSAAGALVISLFVALFFRSQERVQNRETQAVAAA